MSIFDLFSKRQKRLRGEISDVYQYDALPQPFRVQVVHILLEAFGSAELYFQIREVRENYKFVVNTLCREYGVFALVEDNTDSVGDRQYQKELFNFLLNEDNTEKTLDAIELAFHLVSFQRAEGEYAQGMKISGKPKEAIAELNARFQEHGIGYRFERPRLIRVDSEIIHAEVVKPALSLLSDGMYSGAQDEFLKAHAHYREGRAKEALTDGLKSLESVMKSIADKRRWQVNPTATAKTLIELMFTQKVIPDFWAQEWGGLRSILENGVPTARNRLGGHGQGAQPVVVPDHIVAFVLHQTAAAIVYLASAEKALP